MTENSAFGTEIRIKDAMPSDLENLGNTVDNFTKLT